VNDAYRDQEVSIHVWSGASIHGRHEPAWILERGGAHGVRALPESFCKVITTDEPMNADGGREGRLTVRTSNIQQPTLNKRSPIEKRQRTAAVQDAGALAEAPRVFLNISKEAAQQWNYQQPKS